MSLQYSNLTLLDHELNHLKKMEDKFGVLPFCTGGRELGPNSVGDLIALLYPQDDPAEEPIYLIDLGRIAKQMKLWRQHLPSVTPFYAVKCNSSPAVVETLAGMGCGFDCASMREFDIVLGMGVAPERILFANPSLQIPHLKGARDRGIRTVVFDSQAGLLKLKQFHPEAQLFMRIVTDDSKSLCRFSTKFGAPMEDTSALLHLAKELGLSIVGLSFHVGSGCGDAQAFFKAIQAAHAVWTEAVKLGFSMQVLDLGGGFPGNEGPTPSFPSISAVVTQALAEVFGNTSGEEGAVPPPTAVIAEPGRFFACASHSLITTVVAKRVLGGKPPSSQGTPEDSLNGPETPEGKRNVQPPEIQYILNDGVYQSFNCLFFDHATAHPYPIYRSGTKPSGPLQSSTVFGPTCDALDCLAKGIPLPELEIGDYMFFQNMGAYTIAAASPFNGFFQWRYVYLNSLDLEAERQALQEASSKKLPTTTTTIKASDLLLPVVCEATGGSDGGTSSPTAAPASKRQNAGRGRRRLCGWKEKEAKVVKAQAPIVSVLAEG